MADERKRLVVEADYAAALGIALYAFATLELEATLCCEQMEAGSMEALEERTAGRVADTLVHLVRALEPSAERDQLLASSQRFRSLVQVRNALFHARPMALGDTNVLSRNGDPWTVAEITNAADQFARCAQSLNGSLHQYLAPMKSDLTEGE